MCLELGVKGESKILETTSFKKAEQHKGHISLCKTASFRCVIKFLWIQTLPPRF